MLVVPIPIDLYMPHLRYAAKSAGYVGLVLVLARTADAREQHTELGRDWTSLHDVTGPLIGVLCPSPSWGPYESGVIPAYGAGVGVQCLRFQHAHNTDDQQFERAFWDSASCDRRIVKVTNRFKHDIVTPRRPASTSDVAAAWTEMTTLSARYFGFIEEDLPAVVVMSLWEDVAVVVRLRPGLSIYQLLRATISNLDGRPARIAKARDRVRALAIELRAAGEKPSAYRKWQTKVERMEAAIGASKHIDEKLQVRCHNALRAVLATGVPGDAPQALRELHRWISQSADVLPLRHSAVYGLMLQLEAGSIPKAPAEIEAERTKTKNLEQAMCRQLQLSNAVVTAYGQTFAQPTVHTVVGHDGLHGWTVKMVDRLAPPPLRLATRRG